MKNTVLIALSHAWESCLVAVKTTLSYFQSRELEKNQEKI